MAKTKSAAVRTVLGIDPGLALLGVAVLAEAGSTTRALTCGVISTQPGTPLPIRLQEIYRQLRAVIATFSPEEAAIEELFFGRNASTAMAVGQARGVALLALADSGLAVAHYAPATVKLAVTGRGDAEKDSVGEKVRVLLDLPSVPRPDDAADAAAVAICHLRLTRASTPGRERTRARTVVARGRQGRK